MRKKSSNFQYQNIDKKKDFLCYEEAIPTSAMNTQVYQNRSATNPPVLMQFPPAKKNKGIREFSDNKLRR
jgi:hypothetical protein